MSRHSASGSYGHRIERINAEDYLVRWAYDRHLKGSRLRHPQGRCLYTDRAGAERFAKKWGVAMPPEPEESRNA